MRITEFEYTRKFNMGNFEERVLKVKGTIEDGENHNVAITDAMNQVEALVSGKVVATSQLELPIKMGNKEAMKLVKSGEATIPSEAVVPESEVTPAPTKTRTRRTKEEIAAEKADETKVASNDPLVESVVDHITGECPNIHEQKNVESLKSVAEPTPAPEVKKEEPVKEKKAKGVLYSRTVESHKQALVNVLDSICPTWKSIKLAECKQFSSDQDGKIFVFNEDGNVSDDFISKAKVALGV